MKNFQKTIVNFGLMMTLAAAPVAAEYAASTPNSTLTASQQNNLDAIESQLKDLEQELSDLRKKTYNEEIEAQRYLRNNAQEYIQQVQLDDSNLKQINEVKDKIIDLQKKREAILNPAQA